jgi:hypothetical protein
MLKVWMGPRSPDEGEPFTMRRRRQSTAKGHERQFRQFILEVLGHSQVPQICTSQRLLE